MRKHVILLVVIAVIGIINYQIMRKEQVLTKGALVLLELGPRDPRSLMQGDFMVLRYRMPRELSRWNLGKDVPRKGFVVLDMQANKVGVVKRIYHAGDKLEPNQRLIRYRVRKRGLRIGSEAFFFQEGHGKFYERARYGELRLDRNGDSVLVGLRNDKLEPIKPPPGTGKKK